MRTLKMSLIVLTFCALSFAQDKAAPAKADTAKPAAKAATTDAKAAPAAKPATAKKKTAGFDINALDRSVEPCNNFYQFACGTWIKNNPVPSDRTRWGRFNELADNNNAILKEILEAAEKGGDKRNAVDQKIGDFYGSCMDEATINKKGLEGMKPWMDTINGMKSKGDLTDVIIALHKNNGPGFFGFGSGPDLNNASLNVAQFGQDGLGLPNKDYYTKTDAKSVDTREKYVDHVARMFILMGDRPAAAVAQAGKVMEIETDLANASLGPVDLRDPQKQNHTMTVEEWQKLTPSFNYSKYMDGIGAPKVTKLNVAMPDFAKGFEAAIQKYSVDDIKNYLRWHAIHWAARTLPTNFNEENFAFYSKYLGGQKEQLPRWKRCVAQTDGELGEALGIAYVQKAFPKSAKDRMDVLVKNVENALQTDIEGLDWMSPTTKAQAVDKLKAIANKVGHPEKWRDYSSVKIVAGDALGNYLRAQEFELKRQLAKIDKPVDHKEWGMTPPTVNAYYNPQENNINFPAGILQPPFFDNAMDDGVNYGAIGAVIGHELTHGFDDEGAQFDKVGNLKDWWTEADKKAFEERTTCIAKEYDGFIAIDDVHVNGKLTLGENAADNGGVRIALMALQAAMKGKPATKLDGFTPEQRLFLGWGQIWCQNMTPQAARLQAQTDPHSAGQYRVNGVVRNMPEFQKAFSCKDGAPMAPKDRCRVW
jgi:putative endopeptidase